MLNKINETHIDKYCMVPGKWSNSEIGSRIIVARGRRSRKV